MRWRASGRRTAAPVVVFHRIPIWSIVTALSLLQVLLWLWFYRKIRKRPSYFFHNVAIDVDLPLLDAVFLSDLTTTIASTISTTTSSTKDERRCSSPESASPWPLGSCQHHHQHNEQQDASSSASLMVVGRSWTSRRTCGRCNDPTTSGNGGDDPSSSTSSWAQYWPTLAERLASRHRTECAQRIVVYSVALGAAHEQYLWEPPHPYNETTQFGTKLNGADLLRRHGNCFFTFVLRNTSTTSTSATSLRSAADVTSSTTTTTTPVRSADGIDWIVAIPVDVLPYQNHRRNTKLIKLQGHMIFPWAERLIWQDTKFRRFDFSHTRPTDYNRWFNDHVVGNTTTTSSSSSTSRTTTTTAGTTATNAVCAGFYTLPSHENSFGQYVAQTDHHHTYRNQYLHHCETVVEALKIRHTVTDSRAALLHQCRAYVHQARGRFDVDLLSLALIDSAFMGWDLRQAHCRTFAADLTCTWLDELHCYSDRDQISFPHVIRSLQLRPLPGHRYLDPVTTNLEFWSHGQPLARFTQSRCHWYYQEIDACYH